MTQDSQAPDPIKAALASRSELLAGIALNILKPDPDAVGKTSFEAFITEMHADEVAQLSTANRGLLLDLHTDEFRRWQLSKMLGVPVGKDERGNSVYDPAFETPKRSSFVLRG